MCGKLTQEETRDHHSKVVKNIDTGNSVLGLDMVVRDDDGNTLDPEICGAVKLFRAHEKSAEGKRKKEFDIYRIHEQGNV